MYENTKQFLLKHYQQSLDDALRYRRQMEAEMRTLVSSPINEQKTNILKISQLERNLRGVQDRIDFINNQLYAIQNEEWGMFYLDENGNIFEA